MMLVASGLVGGSVWLWERYRYHPPPIPPELLIMDTADPVVDAHAAILKGDFHFVGIYGEGLDVPGLDSPLDWKYREHYPVVGVNGTSDVVGGEQARLQNKARDYAKIYNTLILRKVKTLP
jgi:hypothetical protein